MMELKATDKITQKMTRDGAVSENLATGEVKHISSREPEMELSASSEESAGAAADLALRAAEHHEKKSARKAEKADTQAVRDGSAARQRPSSRLQFTEEERADPVLGKYIDRSDRAADRLDAAKAAIPTKKVLRTERVFDETAGKGKMQLHFEEVEKRPNGRLRHNPLSRPVHEIVHAAHAKVHEVEQENVGVEAGHKGEVLTERGFAYAVYMATLGNREDLFPGSGYVDKYTKPPTTYDIPPSALEDETFAALITEAEKYIGYPYVWGGSNPNTSFDCSGFVSWVLTQSGVCNTGRLGAQGLYNISTSVSSANARPGDLIFFVGTYDTPGVSHVGIYVGGGKMLHCGDPIQYADINTSYWQSHFYAFGRPPYN